jgi:hypothetical protein
MRALRGEVPPIQKHGGQPELEEKAFGLRRGELSSIIQVGQQYVILFCTGTTEPKNVDFAAVRSDIVRDVQEKKQRVAMADLFHELQDNAKTYNYLAGSTHQPKARVEARVDGTGERPRTASRAGTAFAPSDKR